MIKKLVARFHHDFRQAIWQVLPVVENSTYWIETKASNTPDSYFHLIDAEGGQLLHQDIFLGEGVLASMLSANARWLILQVFEDMQNPEHAKVWVFDVQLGEMSYDVPDFTFLHLAGDRLYGLHQLGEDRGASVSRPAHW